MDTIAVKDGHRRASSFICIDIMQELTTAVTVQVCMQECYFGTGLT